MIRDKLGRFTSRGLMGNKHRLGHKPWNVGKKTIKEIRKKQSKSKLKLYKEKGNVIGFQNGKKNWAWKGGAYINRNGYKYIKMREHPNCDTQGYIAEHRLVMEKHLGRYLKRWELIHHKNGIKGDNRINNLDIVSLEAHYGRIHCPFCGEEFLIK